MPSTRMFLQEMLRVAILVAATGVAQHASAHSLSVTRGTATIKRDMLTVQLEPNKHGESLLARLSIRDAQGDRLWDRRASTTRAGAAAKENILRYPLAPDTRFVSFQLVPPHGAGAAHGANVVLTVRVNGEDRDAIRLASSGNVEVVRIAPAAESQMPTGATGGTDPCESRRWEWLAWRSGDRSVRSIVAVEDWGVQIELLVPIPVIETWVPIGRANRDFIEPKEWKRAIAKMEAFVADRFDVRVNGSNPLAPTVRATFLDLADPQTATDREPDRLSAWTTGLRYSLQFRSAQRPDRVEVDWKLFNAIVLTANALMVTPGACNEFDFSTYSPHWTWHRP